MLLDAVFGAGFVRLVVALWNSLEGSMFEGNEISPFENKVNLFFLSRLPYFLLLVRSSLFFLLAGCRVLICESRRVNSLISTTLCSIYGTISSLPSAKSFPNRPHSFSHAIHAQPSPYHPHSRSRHCHRGSLVHRRSGAQTRCTPRGCGMQTGPLSNDLLGKREMDHTAATDVVVEGHILLLRKIHLKNLSNCKHVVKKSLPLL